MVGRDGPRSDVNVLGQLAASSEGERWAGGKPLGRSFKNRCLSMSRDDGGRWGSHQASRAAQTQHFDQLYTDLINRFSGSTIKLSSSKTTHASGRIHKKVPGGSFQTTLFVPSANALVCIVSTLNSDFEVNLIILVVNMSAFPPHRSTEPLSVSQSVALTYLASYLTAAKTSPHLLPNARLEPSGPTSGSSNSSVTIHNLQRVEAGLRGEWLAPTLELNEGVKVTTGMDDGTNTGIAGTETEGEGWMDLDQYQREQSIEGGEVGSPGGSCYCAGG